LLTENYFLHSYEIAIMESLLAAQKGITSYNFKDTIVNLYTAKMNLSAWRELYSSQEYAEVIYIYLETEYHVIVPVSN